MKILGPDDKPLFIDGVPQFAERTCGECARSKTDSAEGCECFVDRTALYG